MKSLCAKFVKRLYFFVIVLFICSISFGQDSKTTSWDNLPFPIISWLGPSANKITDSIFQDMIDAGFTINLSNNLDYSKQEIIHPTLAENLRMLTIAEKVGMKLIIIDSRIDPRKILDSSAYKQLDSVIADYKNCKALLGYFVHDEPNASLFDNVSKIKEYFNKKDSIHLAYVNTFPEIAFGDISIYKDYLSNYMAKVKPQILSFDNYCFKEGKLQSIYFENLEIIRSTSISNGVPFWAFTLSTPHFLYDMPTKGQISFQLYCNLAYGAKGLQYFTYGFIPNLSLMAPIDSLANKTLIWYMGKSINNEILQLAPILKTLKSEEVYHSVHIPQETKGLPVNFYITATDTFPMLIGYFKNQEGVQYVMLVNKKYDQNISVKISFSDSVNSIIEISKKNGTELPSLKVDSNKNIILDFSAGEGRLFRIQKNKYLGIINFKNIPAFYPIPVKDKLTINFVDQNSIKTIHIFSLNSTQVFSSIKIRSSLFEIDMSNYTEGIYFIKIVTNDQMLTKKIIKIASY